MNCEKKLRDKLEATNWLEGITYVGSDCDAVQVQFKNTRAAFFRNSAGLPLEIGDQVVVESAPGYDIGKVSMTGPLVKLQMRKGGIDKDAELKKVIRKPTAEDLEKFEEAKAREHDTMIRSRRIADELELKMKIGDVEFQGDGTKAIFYYIADERVDFRKLIRLLADAFKIRIEMRQIGARQEAGRIGGIGPCGRPLCCSTWLNRFVSVGTGAARLQDLSMNPQKLAGQCAKLKCCLNFETDVYYEAAAKMPPKDVPLETADGTFYLFKSDTLAQKVTYSTDKKQAANLVTISARRAMDIIGMNKEGAKPIALSEEAPVEEKKEYIDLTDQDSLTRFDKAKKKKKKKKGGGNRPVQGSGAQRGGQKKNREGRDDAPPKQE
ncbi:MAG: hypothetical protein J1F07_05035 [Muribaculaceae bacterium]|nr:hypothetical protein [Muribaculaceae bacterium]